MGGSSFPFPVRTLLRLGPCLCICFWHPKASEFWWFRGAALAGDRCCTDVVAVTGLAAGSSQSDLREAGPDTSLHLPAVALQGCPTPPAW